MHTYVNSPSSWKWPDHKLGTALILIYISKLQHIPVKKIHIATICGWWSTSQCIATQTGRPTAPLIHCRYIWKSLSRSNAECGQFCTDSPNRKWLRMRHIIPRAHAQGINACRLYLSLSVCCLCRQRKSPDLCVRQLPWIGRYRQKTGLCGSLALQIVHFPSIDSNCPGISGTVPDFLAIVPGIIYWNKGGECPAIVRGLRLQGWEPSAL